MKLFLLGAPCAGKTTLVPLLRRQLSCPVLDMDEELLRANDGTWPASFELKRALTDLILDEASDLDEVVLANSLLDEAQLERLTAAGWEVGLLDLPESVMRARAGERQAREGWTNIEWLPFHLRNIQELRALQAFSHVFDATRPPTELAATLAALVAATP
ncbi:MAG: hypothetical protein J0I14_06540 [Propionibacteriaceae bacterium]|nr:hypothetical protein [Propionibacteriaceae bacterium]